jgi:hypothetical protein
MRRCEDEKVRYRPPLLEEPCAQTLSGKKDVGCTCQKQCFNMLLSDEKRIYVAENEVCLQVCLSNVHSNSESP